MITRVAKAWVCIMPVGRVMDGPMAVLILSKGTSMQIVLGPVLTRNGGYALRLLDARGGAQPRVHLRSHRGRPLRAQRRDQIPQQQKFGSDDRLQHSR